MARLLLSLSLIIPSLSLFLSLFFSAHPSGMVYLSNQKIIHRDLKSLNVLLSSLDPSNPSDMAVKVAKICDFGLSRKLEQPMPVY